MRRALGLAALVTVALAVTFAAQRPGSDSPLPLVENRGPRGLAVLHAWLLASGVEVQTVDSVETALPQGAGTVVLAAPSARELDEAAVARLRTFVEGGGTLVYLVPRQAPQPLLNAWLDVKSAPVAPLNDEPGVSDVGGSSAKVLRAHGAARGLRSVRLSADTTITVDSEDALEIVDNRGLWWRAIGRGEVWLSAGPDLAQNARLELADNAKFWAQLPAPIVFDETQHRAGGVALPINVLATVVQLLVLAALFIWARGVRLGPPRDATSQPAQSSMDYVRAMATLTRSAKLESELLPRLRVELRAAMQDRAAVPTTWAWPEAARETARRLTLPEAELLAAETTHDVVALSRCLARVEHASVGP